LQRSFAQFGFGIDHPRISLKHAEISGPAGRSTLWNIFFCALLAVDSLTEFYLADGRHHQNYFTPGPSISAQKAHFCQSDQRY
jgi:hypothetical protein